MGYYIETPGPVNKASQLVELYGAEVVDQPSYNDIPEGKAIVVVVQNEMFDAAAFAYDEREYQAFIRPEDPRAKTFLLMDRTKAEELSGYK